MAFSDPQSTDLIELPDDAPIQLFDLKTQQALIRPALEQRWIDILDHGRFIGGRGYSRRKGGESRWEKLNSRIVNVTA